MPYDPRVTVFRPIHAELGEGVMWHPSRQSLFWIDITGKTVFETKPGQGETRSFKLDQMVTALAPTAEGKLVAALHRGIYLLDPDTGVAVEHAVPKGLDFKTVRFNDGKCDPAGRFWAGTMPDKANTGHLYRIDAKDSITAVRDSISCSNGLAWTADAKTMYYIDSHTRCVQAFNFDVETGRLSRRRIAIRFTEQDGLPDGCTIDTEDRLWIAHWGGSKITCWHPEPARLIDTLHLPVSQVTSCTFGGPNLDTLFITSASIGLNEAQKSAEPQAGFLFCAQTGARGFLAQAFYAGRSGRPGSRP